MPFLIQMQFRQFMIASGFQNVQQEHCLRGIILIILLKELHLCSVTHLVDDLPLHLNSLVVQRDLYFVLVWSDISQMVYLAAKIKQRCGMALNSSPVPQGSLDGWFSLLSDLIKDKESSLFWIVPTDYTYWNLLFWFNFLCDSLVACDLCKYFTIFGRSHWIPSSCLPFSVLA